MAPLLYRLGTLCYLGLAIRSLANNNMTSWGPTSLNIFALGTNSSIYHKQWDFDHWNPSAFDWANHGGPFIQPPVSVAWEPNRLDVFTIDLDASLRHQAWDGTNWVPGLTQWDNLGGEWQEKPAVVSWGPNRLDVFLVGTDRGLYQKFWDGSSWNNGFVNLGGKCIDAPSAVSWESGRIDVFCTGTDSNVYHKWFDTTGWHPNGPAGGFENLGGRIVGQPKAVSWGPDRIDLFAVGEDSTLRHKWWDGFSWKPGGATGAWENLGGTWRLTPEAVSLGVGQLDVFVLGAHSSAGSVFHKAYRTNSGWTPGQNQFEPLGGHVANREVKAIVLGAKDSQINLFFINTDSTVGHKSWSPVTGWLPSQLGVEGLFGSMMSPVG